MSFMERQITNKRDWYKIETSQGTFFVDREDAGNYPDADAESVREKVHPLAVNVLGQFVEGGPDSIESWETVKGFGCRLSAPGYMDCTDWTVFDSEDECKTFLDDNYPEDEEE